MQTNKQIKPNIMYCVGTLKKERQKIEEKRTHSQKTWFIMLTELAAAATTATYDRVKISLRK